MEATYNKFQVDSIMQPTPAKNIVEKIHLTSGDAFLPIMECVSNSIINLKNSGLPVSDRKIEVEIVRGEAPQQALLGEDAKPVKDVIVTDNGTGFDDNNYYSFEVPHTNYLAQHGCLGLGRFTVLAAFKTMKIRSNFQANGGWKYREFDFNIENDVTPIVYKDSEDNERKTVVEMRDVFAQPLLSKNVISAENVAKEIMDHFLVFYLSKNLPTIVVWEQGGEPISVNELFQSVAEENEAGFNIGNHEFKLYITRNPKTTNRKHHYYRYCADSRVIGRAKNLGHLDGIFNYPLINDFREFFLDVYVVSDFLDKYKMPTRNAWRIPQSLDDVEAGLFGDDVITFDDIERELVNTLRNEYSEHVKQSQEKSIQEWKGYIKAHPRFHSLANDDDVLRTLPANASDDKRDEVLHRIIYNRQKSVDRKIQEFIEKEQVNEEAIQAVVKEIKDKTKLDADSLADYMVRRKAVIDVFEKFLEADRKGDYKLEADIHNLIFPIRTTSDEIDYEAHNLWLLDERLVSYQFIASEKQIRSYCSVGSAKRADIAVLNFDAQMFDNPIGFGDKNHGELSSLMIFEFKRPGETASNIKNDDRWEFNHLTEKYFDAFRYGDQKVKNKGRLAIVRDNTPKFGYIILDEIPEALEHYNRTKGWNKTPFGTFYKLEPGNNLHLEAMTFNVLIESAKQRHNPFFDKLFPAQKKETSSGG